MKLEDIGLKVAYVLFIIFIMLPILIIGYPISGLYHVYYWLTGQKDTERET